MRISRAFAFLVVLVFPNFLLAASSTKDIDLTGSGKSSRFEYVLTPKGSDYSASLRVVGPDGHELWSQQWEMKADDLKEMMSEEGRKSVDEWVKKFFANKPFETETFARKKLTEKDLSAVFLEDSAKELTVSSNDLKNAILQEKVNFLFTYRSAWREELNALVYVPKYNRFVAYTGYGQ